MERFETFEREAKQLMQAYRVPGCIAALAKDGKIIYQRSFGHRDKERQLEVDEDTVFGLASLTKSFTCAAIMKLQEEGKLSINDPAVKYLPEFQVRDKDRLQEMTIAEFMTHTSGLPPLPSLDLAMVRKRNQELSDHADIPKEADQIRTYEQLMKFISDEKADLVSKPGDLFSYSNDAYSLLGAIIERVSGISYESFVLQNIIQPCGMEQTHFLIEDYDGYENVTTCYEVNEETEEIYVAEDWWDAPPMRATGFLKSTVKDMMNYARLYLHKGSVNGKRILSEKSICDMLYPHVKMDPEKMYGYGFAVTEDYHGTVMIDHGGSLQSISSKFAILPEEGLSVIVLTNLSGFPAGKLLLMLLNAYYGRELDASHLHFEPMELPKETLQSYIGAYTSGEGMDCLLEFDERDEVRFSYKGKEYSITFVSETVFTAMIDDIAEPVEVLKDADGDVFALSIYHRVVPKVREG